jgi:phospholipid transport system substrate-binding protein
MPSIRATLLVLALALLPVAGMPVSGHAATPEAAADFLKRYSDKAVAAMNAEGRTEAERKAEFRRLLREGFDMQALTRFVVDDYADSASEDQLEAFRDAFETKLVGRYAPMLAHLDDVDLTIGEAERVQGRDDLFEVRCDLALQGDRTIPMRWRVRAEDGRFQILDIRTEGISMAVTLRDEYGAVMGDGGIERLTRALRKANAE